MHKNIVLTGIAVLAAALVMLSCSPDEGPFVRDNPLDGGGENWNPPVVTAMADAAVNINDSISVTATGTDNGSVVKYVWAKNGVAFVDTTVAGVLKVAFADSGRKVVRVKVLDDDGVWSVVDSCVITVTLGAPVVTALHDTSVSFTLSGSVQVTAYATDANAGGNIVRYLWDIGADGVWDDSAVSGARTIKSTTGGPVSVRWGARDDDGLLVTDTFLVIFNRPPSSPNVTAPTTYAAWKSFSYQTGKGTLPVSLSATDPDGTVDTLRNTLSTGPSAGALVQQYSGTAKSVDLAGIDSLGTVFWRLVARDLYGDSAVASGSFVAPPPPGAYDIDGNFYPSVKIGTQEWTTVNLRVTKYKDGTPIPCVTATGSWSALTTPGYCYYNNDSTTNKMTYGALYNWYAVNTGKLAPAGWHVPTDAEWTTLTTYLGGEAGAGGKLKKAGTTHWTSPNTGATNETGFTALPGGYRNYGGTFYYVGSNGYWWSATAYDATNAWYRGMSCGNASVSRYFNYGYSLGFSVRCVRD